MSERAPTHAQEIARDKKLAESQAAERKRLTAELAPAELECRAWVSPKTRYELAKNALANFTAHSQALNTQSKARVAAAADPRIHAAIKALAREEENICASFSVEGRRARGDRASNAAAKDASLKVMRTARAELEALLFVECADVPAAIKRILSKIPSISELEYA